MKTLAIVVMVSCWVGCTASQTQVATYQPRGTPGPPWKIEAQWHEIGDRLNVIIDGTVIISTGAGIFTGRAEASADYDGRKITARILKSGELFQEKRIVEILVDEELIASFEF